MNSRILRVSLLLCICLFASVALFAADKVFPDKPNPPRLVNDFAGMMSPAEQAQLESKLLDYSRTSSTEVTIVTITSLGEYDIADYTLKLGNLWGVGKTGKSNGVVILAALQEHKIWIATGKGLEGALTDYTSGKIRDNMKPYFKAGKYFQGFNVGVDNVIAATKGEFKADPGDSETGKKQKGIPRTAIIILIVFVYLIIRVLRGNGRGGNGGGGSGLGNLATGMLIGNMLGGGRGGFGGGGFDGGGDSGGGFGGFGGGSFGGGGAGGSWD